MIVKTKKVLITGVRDLTLANGETVTKIFVREPDGHRTSFIDNNREHVYQVGKANLMLSLKQSKDYHWNISAIGSIPETPVSTDTAETVEKVEE